MRCAEAYRPFRGDPFPGRMRKNGREAKKAGFFIDARCLDRRDLMPAKALADNVLAVARRRRGEGARRSGAVSFDVLSAEGGGHAPVQ